MRSGGSEETSKSAHSSTMSTGDGCSATETGSSRHVWSPRAWSGHRAQDPKDLLAVTLLFVSIAVTVAGDINTFHVPREQTGSY